jgi:hypothetical protein
MNPENEVKVDILGQDGLFVHVSGLINVERQVKLVSTVSKYLVSQQRPYRYGFDKLCAVPREDMPTETLAILEEPQKLLKAFEKQNISIPWIIDYKVALVEVLGYESASHLNPHVDHVKGITIIISLGATANFFFQIGSRKERQKTEKQFVKVKSGDCIVFPTDRFSAVFHGIESFDDDKPEYFNCLHYERICIQYRQYRDHVVAEAKPNIEK